MRKISKSGLAIIFILGCNSSLHATENKNIFLNYCNHFGPGVSYSFQSCINNNFSTISRHTQGFYSYCTNFGQEVDYGFTSCVNRNFQEAQRQLQNRIWLQYCYNYDRSKLDYSFISCVNSNYGEIQREINKI